MALGLGACAGRRTRPRCLGVCVGEGVSVRVHDDRRRTSSQHMLESGSRFKHEAAEQIAERTDRQIEKLHQQCQVQERGSARARVLSCLMPA